MYIRKDIKDFIERMPKEMKLPRHWKKFINYNNEKYNLIIKHGNEYECTNCRKYFNIEANPGDRAFCPFCNNLYLVRNSNLKHFCFKYYLALIDNFDNKLMIRYFEMERLYYRKTRTFEDDIVEYARVIPELDVDLANDRYYKYLSAENVVHTKRIKRWRVFTGIYGLQQYFRKIYLEDIKEKTKGTIYQYAPIKEAIEYLQNDSVDLLGLLRKAKYNSFELLMKLGLYNLALECPEKFNNSGSFEKRFGISKDYYEFMKKYDINDEQLETLKLIKVKDIKLINRLLKISNNNEYELERASKYINLIKLGEYAKTQKKFDIITYLDYIRNMEKLDIPLTNKILMPEDINEAHYESIKKVRVLSSKVINKKMINRYKELQKNAYNDNIYFIRPAKNVKDMKDEAKQQDNCVYKNYSESYAFGDTDIYFLRDMNKPDKSLVTVEVFKNKIRQKYQRKNELVTEEQNKFLLNWEKNIIQKAA